MKPETTPTVLAIRALPKGGFVVYEPASTTGMLSIEHMACGNVDAALHFIKTAFERELDDN